jgi:hypothetical protein
MACRIRLKKKRNTQVQQTIFDKETRIKGLKVLLSMNPCADIDDYVRQYYLIYDEVEDLRNGIKK